MTMFPYCVSRFCSSMNACLQRVLAQRDDLILVNLYFHSFNSD